LLWLGGGGIAAARLFRFLLGFAGAFPRVQQNSLIPLGFLWPKQSMISPWEFIDGQMH